MRERRGHLELCCAGSRHLLRRREVGAVSHAAEQLLPQLVFARVHLGGERPQATQPLNAGQLLRLELLCVLESGEGVEPGLGIHEGVKC